MSKENSFNMIWCPFASTLLVCVCVCVRLTGEELIGCHRPVLHYFTWQWRRHLNGENVTVGQRPGLYSVPGLLTNCSPPKLQLYISTTKTTIKTTLTYDRGFSPDLSIIVCLFCTLCLSWSCTIHTLNSKGSCNGWIGWSDWLHRWPKTTGSQGIDEGGKSRPPIISLYFFPLSPYLVDTNKNH